MEIFALLALIFGFYMSWNIGANDASNAVGTAVGSKALTLKKALIIAAILEFAGAFLLGSNVSSTIQQDIVNPDIFALDPKIFALGMLAALVSTGIWLNVASLFHMPISATHAIVGSVIGFGLVIGGVHSIEWNHVTYIALSWIFAPLLSGVVAFYIFKVIKNKILYAFNPLKAAKKTVPFIIFFTSFYFIFSIVHHNTHFHFSFILSLLISGFNAFIFMIIAFLMLKRIPSKFPPKREYCASHLKEIQKAIREIRKTKLSSLGKTNEETTEILKKLKKLEKEYKKKTSYSFTHEQYQKIEKIFAHMQLLSASMVAFAHGANDVANAIGPVAAIVEVAKTNAIPHNFIIPTYILLLGAIGIVIGLATWGWRVIATIGKKITELTPTRAFAAELGCALTIILASKLGMPISTTHALVGAVFGIGIARGLRSINLKIAKDIFLSWFITMPLCAILAIISFYFLKWIFI